MKVYFFFVFVWLNVLRSKASSRRSWTAEGEEEKGVLDAYLTF